jgi:serpin B
VRRKLFAPEMRLIRRIDALRQQVDPTDLALATAVWADQACPLSEPYLGFVRQHHGPGTLRMADFRRDPEGERLRINAWVAETTQQRIRDVLSPSSVDALCRLVLANAVHFKSEWACPFSAACTETADFHLAGGGTVRIPLMTQTVPGARYGAFDGDGQAFDTPVELAADDRKTSCYPDVQGFALLELPYRGGRFAMVVLAPNRADGLEAVERRLDRTTLTTWTATLRPRTVHVRLPRFTAERTYDLSQSLSAMGMPTPFVRPTRAGGADFGGMTESTELENRLYLSRVTHAAGVEVNETGTEAAAATAAVARATASLQARVPFVPEFRADRPFQFWVRETTSGCLLFLGRVTNPVSSGSRGP